MLIDNIIAQADIKTQQEYRVFICKMNREVIREITNQSYKKVYSPQLGGSDEFSFSIPKFYDGQLVQNYENILGNNLIKVQKGTTDIGYFEIQNPQITNDGISEIKNIKAYSAEVKLINKKFYLTNGTFKIINNTTPSKGILNQVVAKAKSWSIGYIDPVLINKERYFDIADTNVYELLTGQVQKTFECVLIYDTINKTIGAISLDNYGSNSDIIISMQNIMQSASIETIDSDIVTKLNLFGDNELSIRDINFGDTGITNYAYFMNTGRMSQGLINALTAYNAKVASYQTTYSNYLNTLDSLESQLVTANSELTILQDELLSLEEQRSYLQSLSQSTLTIQAQIDSKNAQIITKINTINSLNSSITSVNTSINSLINILSESSNFTTAQLEELDHFIKEDTYQDSSFLVTDSTTYSESIVVQKALLEAGTKVLARVSYPRYKISIDVVDFLKNKEFAPWWNKLVIGDVININVDDSFVTSVRVTGYTHDWDDNKLTIQLGDKYQFDDPEIQLMDLLTNSINKGITMDYERGKYKEYSVDKPSISSYINSSLDLNAKSIVGGTNVLTQMDQAGILMTSKDPNTGLISPEQLRIAGNSIVLTDDAFNSARVAIGKGPNGKYCIVADVIAGNMILGNSMIIETESGDFRVDGNGVNITKMALNLTSSDNLKNILIDPSVGIKIRSRQSPSQAFADRFYFDNVTGKFKFNGTLDGTDGNFTGTMTAGSIVSSNISGGSINGTTITGSTINGNTINGGYITGSSISGNSISGGSISGTTVTGGTITGTTINGVNISSATIEGTTISGATIYSNYLLANNNMYIVTSQVGQGLQFVGATNAYVRQAVLANSLEIGQNLYVTNFANIPSLSSNYISASSIYMGGSLVATVATTNYLQLEINSIWSYIYSMP